MDNESIKSIDQYVVVSAIYIPLGTKMKSACYQCVNRSYKVTYRDNNYKSINSINSELINCT